MPTEQRSKCALAVSDALIVEPLRLGKRQELQGKQDGELEAIDHETPHIEQNTIQEGVACLCPGLTRSLGDLELMKIGGSHVKNVRMRHTDARRQGEQRQCQASPPRRLRPDEHDDGTAAHTSPV